MKNIFSRRNFVRSSVLLATASAIADRGFALTSEQPLADEASPIRLGLASYTLRNFSRAQIISFAKQLNVLALNAKDVKDHLPMDPQEEAAALADYAAANIKLHAAGTIYFPKDEDAEIRSKFEYCKRAGVSVIVAGDPAPETLPRIENSSRRSDAWRHEQFCIYARRLGRTGVREPRLKHSVARWPRSLDGYR
jgi:hypothetical protein